MSVDRTTSLAWYFRYAQKKMKKVKKVGEKKPPFQTMFRLALGVGWECGRER